MSLKIDSFYVDVTISATFTKDMLMTRSLLGSDRALGESIPVPQEYGGAQWVGGAMARPCGCLALKSILP